MIINGHRNILIAPLDWGLGHTTRCVPIIQFLQENGCQVVFAGNDWQCNYIIKTFADIEIIHLEGYEVTYSKRGSTFMFSLFAQLPRLLKKIRYEQLWLQRVSTEKEIHGIISDNRYGLFSDKIPSIMLTHQLHAQTGLGNIGDYFLRKLHYKYIRRYNECWVVDVAGKPNLSGALGHPSSLPENATYIGLLSQLSEEKNLQKDGNYLLILLSGPEPQRTMLSNLLWKQCLTQKNKIIFIEGNNKIDERKNIPGHIQWYPQLVKTDLLPFIKTASLVICRSGYSTLMDLVALDKKAILIPTPGQTEQEYLGKHLHKQGVFYSVKQNKFNLNKALQDSKKFPFKKSDIKNGFDLYKNVLNKWLKYL